jgi:hypothetical protein
MLAVAAMNVPFPTILLHDRDFWSTVQVLIEAYGPEAAREAGKRAERARGDGDAVQTGMWLCVRDAAQEMLRTRRSGERTN